MVGTKQPPPGSHWRDSAREPRLFIIDAKAVFPLVFFLFYIRWWTFFVALFFTLFFSMLARYGFTISVFMRWLRAKIAGSRKMAKPWWV